MVQRDLRRIGGEHRTRERRDILARLRTHDRHPDVPSRKGPQVLKRLLYVFATTALIALTAYLAAAPAGAGVARASSGTIERVTTRELVLVDEKGHERAT